MAYYETRPRNGKNETAVRMKRVRGAVFAAPRCGLSLFVGQKNLLAGILPYEEDGTRRTLPYEVDKWAVGVKFNNLRLFMNK